ncbi:hypothetical protein CIG75_04315 [Tumebacillus algifaecis]|uniref:Uncharacterized protein n=2 Tax=Tumebacillus algifaecis TaxID=1214604 RepID=A0A223CYF5_9BACL|nr:hypothetical protein CIG75_04315 [Tumebacillus algifaecis]
MVTGWYGWPIERVVILLLGLMFFMIFVQVTMYHYRQNFRHWSMWIPVLATPIDGLALVTLTFANLSWLRAALSVLLAASLLAGAFGSFMHLRGVGERVGGYEMRNFLVGPPATLPGLITLSSVIGLILLYWA